MKRRAAEHRNGVIPWLTVEHLAPDAMSVTSAGNEPRDFADWRRVLQRQLTKLPAVYDGISTRGLTAAIASVVESAEAIHTAIETSAGEYLLLVHPVLGPSGAVHATQVWLGPRAATVPDRPSAAGAIWDLASQTLAQSSDITGFTGIVAEEFVPHVSVAEFFHRITAFDQHAQVLDLLYRPESGGKLQFEASATHPAGRSTRWRISIRARDDQHCRGAWWLIEDVTSSPQPATWPTLESVGLREAHRRAGNHLAVVQLSHTSISHWLTDPAPWVRWDYLFRPIDVFHPDDRDQLAALRARMRSGETASITVRALNYAGGYTPTAIQLYPYPGFANSELAIAQLTPIADDAPVGPERCLLESHRTSAPIGYDEQLRYRLLGRSSKSAVSS